jgi:2-desacetyl-2-hydroxyethyl bacteriochlorophyllide A dehydrogenase
MWTSTLDLDPKKGLMTRLLSRVWRNVYFSSFAPLQVRNVPRQSLPVTSWVRVRNRLAGISGTDLLLVQGKGDRRIAPAALPRNHQIYPGSEVVGEVIEIGEGVQRLRVGDRVALQYGSNCISSRAQYPCRACAEGNYNLCERGAFNGSQALGGGWSEEMLLHEEQLFRVAPELSDEQAVMLAPTATALHAVLRHFPQQGERVLIIGAGTIGLLILQLVHTLAPHTKVSVLAKYPFQVEQATRMGADHIIYPNDSYAGIQHATNAQDFEGGMPGNHMLMGGYDSIYDAVGSRKTLHHALRWVRACGTVVLIGTSLYTMQIDLTPIWFREINLLGVFHHGLEYWPVGTLRQQTTFSIAEQLLRSQQLHPEQLITHRFALNNYREALAVAMSKGHSRAIKVVFDYSLVPASVVPNVRASARKPRPTASIASTTMEHPTPEQSILSSAAPQITPVLEWEKGDETTDMNKQSVLSGPETTGQPATEEGTTASNDEQPYIADEEEVTVRVRPRDAEEVRRAVEQATARRSESPAEPEARAVPYEEQPEQTVTEQEPSRNEAVEETQKVEAAHPQKVVKEQPEQIADKETTMPRLPRSDAGVLHSSEPERTPPQADPSSQNMSSQRARQQSPSTRTHSRPRKKPRR